jgi:hypothetical protein
MDNIVEIDGRYFIRTASLDSLLEAFHSLQNVAYEELRQVHLKKYSNVPGIEQITINMKLRTILFEIMPHFIRKNRGFQRRSLNESEVLDLITESIPVPDEYLHDAGRYFDVDPLRQVITNIEESQGKVSYPRSGLISSGEIRLWFFKALEAKILQGEKHRLKRLLRQREHLANMHRKHAATLLYIADKGALEMDGFGFLRINGTEEFLVYRRTGEYALKDYSGQIYLFPDCRVAISTIGPMRPEVMDLYKHPLLLKQSTRQKICVRRYFIPAPDFNAKSAIRALEEGINALFYGYSGKRRNGFHRLDPISNHIQTISFDELRVTRHHPKIASGQVEIKNDFY